MSEQPEPKSPTEPLDLQRKIADIVAGVRPSEPNNPYFAPDYQLPFVHIGTERQLFLDNFMLDHLEGVERRFPTPDRPDEPVLEVGDLPWENPAYANPAPSAALFDPADQKFKLWYIQSLTGDPFNTGQVLCYAESTDCLHWQKPLSDACLPYQGHKATNIVAQDASAVTVVLNHDQRDPQRKFLMLNCPYGAAKSRGLRIMSSVAVSPDGLRWTTISEDSPLRHQHGNQILWDAAIQKWVGYGQYSHHWNFLHRKRQIGRQESSDFIHWSPREAVISVDNQPDLPPNLEFHEMSVRKIGGLYIGITGEFMAEPVWNVRNDTNWRDQAHVKLGLYVSRDGRQWQRVGGPQPWVDNRAPGSIDYGYLCATAGGQLLHNGKSHILYLACPDKQSWYAHPPPTPMVPESTYSEGKRAWEQLGQIMGQYPRRPRATGVLILREDGWAELKPTYEQGRVITRQFVFEGAALRVNADAYSGYLRVEALDPYFQPYPGFSADECDPIYSDDPQRIWHRVTWQGNADVRALWNKPVRLIFHLHQASLYAFQFVDADGRLNSGPDAHGGGK